MEKQLTEFLWQMATVIVFMGGITLFFGLNTMNQEMNQVIEEHLAGSRGVLVEVPTSEDFTVKGHALYGMLEAGITIPIKIGSQYYSQGDSFEGVIIVFEGKYKRTYVLDSKGDVNLIQYERVG